MSEVIVDTSAVLAILFEEEDGEILERVLLESDPVMSTATRIELAHVALRRLGPDGVAQVEGALADLGVRFEPFDEAQAEAAIHAILAYGKGRGQPPAALNMGDTFSYALAKTRGLPLLYKGEDFSRTDIRSALDAHTGDDGPA